MTLLGADEFVQAFAQHGRALWVLAGAWVGRGEAEDLVQETARVAWQRREQFVPGSDVRAWLSQIARHLGSNWRRHKRPLTLAPEEWPLREVPPATAPAVTWPINADHGGLSDELTRALASLPEVARACLLLHVVVGQPFAAIATMLDIPENTAASHARRARITLRATLAAPNLHSAPLPESS